MSEDNKKVPVLRFRGFKDDWEQRKLSEVANHRGGTAIEKYFKEDGRYKVISIGSYGLDSKYVDQNIRAVSNEVTDGRVVHNGELTMVLNDKTANGTIIGRSLLIEQDNQYIINQRTEIISPKENFDSEFAYTILNGPFREKVKRIVQGGTQIYVNYSAVENLALELPCFEEQQKIGTLFKQLDTTITLHQRKLDLLKQMKKGFLQRMFPKSDEKVPELRFDDFISEWKQRKLGTLANFSKGNGYKKNDLIERGSPIILYGRLYTKYETIINRVDTFVEKKDKSVVSEGNEVIVPASGEKSEDISRAAVVGKSGIILGGDLNIIKPNKKIDSTFLALTISNGTQQKEMSKRAQGKSVVHLHNSDLKQVNLLYPQKEEQQKIGSFFKQLDDIIILRQEKLDKLVTLKKSYLQKLFI